MSDPPSPPFVGAQPPTGDYSPRSSPPIPPPQPLHSGRPPRHPGPPPPRTPKQEAAFKEKGIAGVAVDGRGRKTRKRKSKSRRRRNGRTYRRS